MMALISRSHAASLKILNSAAILRFSFVAWKRDSCGQWEIVEFMGFRANARHIEPKGDITAYSEHFSGGDSAYDFVR